MQVFTDAKYLEQDNYGLCGYTTLLRPARTAAHRLIESAATVLYLWDVFLYHQPLLVYPTFLVSAALHILHRAYSRAAYGPDVCKTIHCRPICRLVSTVPTISKDSREGKNHPCLPFCTVLSGSLVCVLHAPSSCMFSNLSHVTPRDEQTRVTT